ncbi:DUF1534 domain-containing protein [Pseudomonas syringae]|nr:DUF1534 domain-containing protein [Pseudomonas syringae]MCF5183746.1 DUF1534 domain-containing protein [Pseudomonas syringae]MCF5316163.1 DUF1534 domain-containing protein [Pseudomonas syringae]MCF5364348.1 DUF1534 domain-containing protein [Pseudomonas syringae]MCF5393917.1 DUF1534 domain-containing protein [Pseudomonas syringae]
MKELSFLTLQYGNAFHDAPRRKRTRSVRNGMRRRAPHDSRDYRSSRSSVGMPWVTLCVTDLRRAARRDRTRSVRNGMRRRAPHDSRDYRSVGMPWVTLCVKDLRRAACSG